jgi:hypothetical protein
MLFLHDGDFFLRQAVQVVNQPVDFGVYRFNLALNEFLGRSLTVASPPSMIYTS